MVRVGSSIYLCYYILYIFEILSAVTRSWNQSALLVLCFASCFCRIVFVWTRGRSKCGRGPRASGPPRGATTATSSSSRTTASSANPRGTATRRHRPTSSRTWWRWGGPPATDALRGRLGPAADQDTHTFTFRAFNSGVYPKRPTISTVIRMKRIIVELEHLLVLMTCSSILCKWLNDSLHLYLHLVH